MDGKSFFYGAFSVLFLLLLMMGFGAAHIGTRGSGGSVTGNVIASSSADPMAGHHAGNPTSNIAQPGFENIPENCRPPAGQDLTSWKEHLGHHQETKECLKYFE